MEETLSGIYKKFNSIKINNFFLKKKKPSTPTKLTYPPIFIPCSPLSFARTKTLPLSVFVTFCLHVGATIVAPSPCGRWSLVAASRTYSSPTSLVSILRILRRKNLKSLLQIFIFQSFNLVNNYVFNLIDC